MDHAQISFIAEASLCNGQVIYIYIYSLNAAFSQQKHFAVFILSHCFSDYMALSICDSQCCTIMQGHYDIGLHLL